MRQAKQQGRDGIMPVKVQKIVMRSTLRGASAAYRVEFSAILPSIPS
jgi:hypothetical protein